MAGGYPDGLRRRRPWCGTAPPTQLQCHSPTHAEFVTCNHTIEGGFKDIKRGGRQWHQTKMTDPARATRLWLAIAVGTLWAVSVGGEVDATLPASSLQELPAL